MGVCSVDVQPGQGVHGQRGSESDNKQHRVYHDEPLGQPGPGKKVDDPQPLGQAQIPEGRRLQGDGVGGGWLHGWLALVPLGAAHWLCRGHAGFCRQPFVQVSELPTGEHME